MSFAFMPVYTGDYLRDTQHLSCSEHGIYFKLLMHCWDQKGPAPLDERKLCGIVNARSADEVEALRRVLSEFFTYTEFGWHNNRMEREINRANALSERLSTAGKLGARKRKSLNRQGISTDAKPELSQGSWEAKPLPHTPTPTLTPTPTTTTTPRKAKAKAPAAPLPAGFELTDALMAYGLKLGLDRGEIRRAFDRFRDHAVANGRQQSDWAAAFRLWCGRDADRKLEKDPPLDLTEGGKYTVS